MKKDEDEISEIEKTKRELHNTEYLLERTTKKLNTHLYNTYGILWTTLIIVAGVLHAVAGSFMFFHVGEITTYTSERIPFYFCLNDSANLPSFVYFMALWIIIFVVLFIIHYCGMKEIRKSLNNY